MSDEIKDTEVDSENQEPKDKKQRIINIILIVIGAALIIFAGYNLFKIFYTYEAEDKANDEVAESCVTVKHSASETAEDTEIPWYDMFSVNLAEAQSINSDVCGWLIFENEDISYGICQGKDNDEYLHTSVEGTYAKSGAIFMDAANTNDFSDSHTIIYGHNMKDTSMFGKLKYYNKENYYADHQYFQIFTNDTVYRYQIFSYHDVEETSSIYTIYYSPGSDFASFVKSLQRASYTDSDATVDENSKVITLSTCSSEGHRLVVHAVRVDEHALSEGAQ